MSELKLPFTTGFIMLNKIKSYLKTQIVLYCNVLILTKVFSFGFNNLSSKVCSWIKKTLKFLFKRNFISYFLNRRNQQKNKYFLMP